MRVSDLTQSRQIRMKMFTHLIVIVILFVLPEVIMNYSRPNRPTPFAYAMYFKAVVYVAVFYIDYSLIIGRTLLRQRGRRVWAFAGWNILVVLASLIIMNIGWRLIFEQYGTDSGAHHGQSAWDWLSSRREMLRMASHLIRDAVMVILTIALSVALKLSESWSDIERRHSSMLAAKRSDELHSLRSQLNPHFLFNTLNTIYALIAVEPEKAQQAVHRLSKLLRYVLYENPSTVSLRSEIDFARNYISLMETRMAPGAVKTNFSDGSEADTDVAPLLFIALIENAFKHGDTRTAPIEIEIKATPGGTVICRTRNKFIPTDKDTPGGIGLSNLRRRLLLLYGDSARLDTRVEDDTYTATLTIHRQ